MSDIENERAAYSREELLFDYAPLGIAEVAFTGQFLRVNQKYLDITGYSRDELLTLNFQDITHPDDLQKDQKLLKEIAADQRTSYSIEKRYIDVYKRQMLLTLQHLSMVKERLLLLANIEKVIANFQLPLAAQKKNC